MATGNPSTFAFFDEGKGLMLFAGGQMRRISGQPETRGISRWDGATWSNVGGGIEDERSVQSFAEYDEGAAGGVNPALFVAGTFRTAGTLAAGGIARWDGKQWSTVGELGTEQGAVYSLCVFDAGDGPMLYVGGSFSRVGGPSNWITAPRLARWDGREWSAVPGWTAPGGGGVRAMAVFDDDGDGPNKPALFITGFFAGAAGTNASSIIKWDGQTWDAMNGGLGGFGRVGETLHVFDDDGDGPNPGGLYIGGVFDTAGGVWSLGLARWGCPLTPPCLADCDFSTGFGTLDVFDFLCFLNRFHAEAPYACNCDVSTGDNVCDIFDFLCYGQRFQAGCP